MSSERDVCAAAEIAGIEARLLTMIDVRGHAPGTRLPTERALAETLGGSRWAVRKALDRLEADGRIWRHVGRGTFVGPRPRMDPAALRLLGEHASPVELTEARDTLEPRLAADAAVRASPAQIERIRDAQKRCASAKVIETYEVWDEAFHRAVAEAAGNRLLLATFEMLNALRKEMLWLTMRKAVLHPERRAFFSEQHARILAAIVERAPDEAARAMHVHMAAIGEVYAQIEAVRRARLPAFPL